MNELALFKGSDPFNYADPFNYDFIFGNDNGNCGMSKPYRTDKDIQFLFMEAA